MWLLGVTSKPLPLCVLLYAPLHPSVPFGSIHTPLPSPCPFALLSMPLCILLYVPLYPSLLLSVPLCTFLCPSPPFCTSLCAPPHLSMPFLMPLTMLFCTPLCAPPHLSMPFCLFIPLLASVSHVSILTGQGSHQSQSDYWNIGIYIKP